MQISLGVYLPSVLGAIAILLLAWFIGYWLADLAAKAIVHANPESRGMMARIALMAILDLAITMGLRAMGVADDIVNLAFGLVLGAIAVVVALAFGPGGRKAAGRIADRWASEHLARKPPPQQARVAWKTAIPGPPSASGTKPPARNR